MLPQRRYFRRTRSAIRSNAPPCNATPLAREADRPESRVSLGGFPGPGDYVAWLEDADSGAAGLGGETVGDRLEQRLGLHQSKAEAEHEDAGIALVDAADEIVLLGGSEGVTDDRHLAVRGKLNGAGHTVRPNRAVPSPFENESSGGLEIRVS